MYYVIFDTDIRVVGPRIPGPNALLPNEEFLVGPYEIKLNAEKEAQKLRALARSAKIGNRKLNAESGYSPPEPIGGSFQLKVRKTSTL